MWLNYNRFLFESEIDRATLLDAIIYVYISNESSSKTGESVNIIWKSNGLNNWITRVRNFILIEIPKFEINWIDKFSKWNYVEWISIPLFNRSRRKLNRNRNNWSKKKRKKKKTKLTKERETRKNYYEILNITSILFSARLFEYYLRINRENNNNNNKYITIVNSTLKRVNSRANQSFPSIRNLANLKQAPDPSSFQLP